MRIHLPELFRRHLLSKRRAAESLRARWQGNHPHAQGAARGAWQVTAGTGASKTPTPADATAAPAAAPGCSRESPAAARFLSRTRLNKPGSEKETWHIELDLEGTGIDYTVGDAFGIFPTNDPALADAVIAALAAPADFPIGGRALRDVLIDGVSLGSAPDMLFQLFSYITGGERRQKAKALAAGEDPDGDAATLDVLAAIGNSPACVPTRKPSSKRSIRCSRGSTRSRPRPGSIPSAWRYASMRCAIPSMAGPGSASPPPFSATACVPATRSRSMSRRRAFRPARRSVAAGHHDRPRHRHCAVPRLPARAHGGEGARAATGCSSAISATTTTSSMRTSSPA